MGDDAHAQALEPPAHGPPHVSQPHQAGCAAGQLPGSEALVGNGSVTEDLAGSHIGVGAQHAAGGRQEQGDAELGDGIGVAGWGAQDGDSGLGGGRDVDVVGVPSAAGQGHERLVEDRPGALIGLDHDDRGPLVGDPPGQALGVVDPQRLLLDPRV